MRVYAALGSIILILLLGGGWWISELQHDLKSAKESASEWESKHAQAVKNAVYLQEQYDAQSNVVTELRNRKQEIVKVIEVQYETITKYKDNPNNHACGINGEWVYQYDSAARLSSPTPFRPGVDETRERTYDDQLVLKVAVHNLRLYWEASAQLTALQNACDNMITKHNERVKEINQSKR